MGAIADARAIMACEAIMYHARMLHSNFPDIHEVGGLFEAVVAAEAAVRRRVREDSVQADIKTMRA